MPDVHCDLVCCAPAIETYRKAATECQTFSVMDEKQHKYAAESLERAGEVLRVARTTKLECLVGRSLLRGKKDRQKRCIESYKVDFEETTQMSAQTLANPRLWAMADKILSGS